MFKRNAKFVIYVVSETTEGKKMKESKSLRSSADALDGGQMEDYCGDRRRICRLLIRLC